MEAITTHLDGPILIQPRVLNDDRGCFYETYRRSSFAELGITDEMVQDNHSRSSHGVVRGMHFQIGAGAAKLVRCARGAIFDVVVDIRLDSPTFGRWEGFELTQENMRMLYCPIGFAHGFCVTSDVADVIYKQSSYYEEERERGVAFDDPEIGIEWPVAPAELNPSARDAAAPMLCEVASTLPFTMAGSLVGA